MYPFQTGNHTFDDHRETLSVPLTVQVLRPSRLRWLVARAYLFSGSGGAAVFLWEILTFLCVVMAGKLASGAHRQRPPTGPANPPGEPRPSWWPVPNGPDASSSVREAQAG